MFQLRGVSKSFGTTQALAPCDRDIQAGRTTALIGPSGCGKSTLLRLTVGLIRPDDGRARFEGIPLSPENVEPMRLRMGYVIQDGGLFPHLTARRNATLMARYVGWDRRRIAERLEELTDLTKFPADGLERFPAQLSGGQRQRVSLMRALMLDPDVLLLVEPLGALDPMIRADLQEDLRDIFQTLAKTVVTVTHDMGEAGFLGDTIVLMRAGRIVQQGTLQELVAATLGALIGAGGYGQPILTGIRLDDTGLILLGAVPAALLALVAQGLFEWAERTVVPKGLRLKAAA